MYSCEELLSLEKKPKINDISLELLCEFYEKYLMPYTYKYTINNKNHFELIFKESHFCHLLGIESIVKKSVSQKNLKSYRGISGWNNIKNGTLTIKELKKINKSKFNSMKTKMIFFYTIPNLMLKPIAVKYEKSNAPLSTRIECDFMFFDKVKNENAIIHLGIQKEDNSDYYFPKTFFIEKVSAFDDDIYINNQEKIIVIKI